MQFKHIVVNAVTCLRFPLAIAVVWLLARHAYGWALAAIVFGQFTDWIDGPLARWWKAETDFGATKLEPLADTALMVSVVVGALLAGVLPWPAFVAIGVLHVLIDFGLKRVFPRPDRIVFFQALAMESAMIGACAYLILQTVPQMIYAAIPLVPTVMIFKRKRIATFARWCFRPEQTRSDQT